MSLNTQLAAGFFFLARFISHLQLSYVSCVNTCRVHISCTDIIVTQKHSQPFICTLIHAAAGTDSVNLLDALKQLKHNYCHI